jgi:hypothetical protein
MVSVIIPPFGPQKGIFAVCRQEGVPSFKKIHPVYGVSEGKGGILRPDQLSSFRKLSA